MVFKNIEEILENQFNVKGITPATNIREDLDLDSIGILEFVMTLEEKFAVTIDDNELDNIITIEDAVKYIEEASK